MARGKKTQPAHGVSRKRAEKSAAAAKAKNRFIANMSHELRTPLNAIIAFSEIMRDQIYGPLGHAKYIEYNNDIHASGRHLLSVINDILDLSKLEAEKMSLHESTVDLRDAVRGAMSQIQPLADKAGVQLKAMLAPEPAKFVGDGRLVLQIVLNLLSNAVKFTPSGGFIIVEVQAMDTGSIALFVRDTGIGIAAKDMARVMEPFGQVDAAQGTTANGTGLGLPLVKSFVELHDGSFELQSTVGVGTTAIVIFPDTRRVTEFGPGSANQAVA